MDKQRHDSSRSVQAVHHFPSENYPKIPLSLDVRRSNTLLSSVLAVSSNDGNNKNYETAPHLSAWPASNVESRYRCRCARCCMNERASKSDTDGRSSFVPYDEAIFIRP